MEKIILGSMHKDTYKGIIVSETHWDREWYLSFQEFRKWLVKMIDDLLENLHDHPGFQSFMLDGQTVLLDDYLEIRPENRQPLIDLINKGRIIVGPFYVLADEFLESGEGLIRNLLLGHKICDDFGVKPMKAGYVPDTFGHIWQLPQVLKGFDIPSIFYLRGYPPVFGNHKEYEGENEDTPLEHWYQSPDGSKVLNCHLILGYGNFAGITEGKMEQSTKNAIDEKIFPWVSAVFKIANCFETMIPRMKTNILLLMNGTDHREAEWELPELIQKFNKDKEIQEDFPIQLEHGGLEQYTEEVLEYIDENKIKLPTITGEARGSMYSQVTPACISTRMNLKLLNWECQRELEKYSEPFSAMAWILGGTYQGSYIELAWKWLIKNHPHDSICGCSLDRVHEDMITRFRWAFDNAGDVSKYSCATILSAIDCDALKDDMKSKFKGKGMKVLAVFNPNAFSGPFFVEDYIAASSKSKYILVDQFGNELSSYDITYIPDYRENVKKGQYFYKQFQSNYSLVKLAIHFDKIPAFGYKILYLISQDGTPSIQSLNPIGLPDPVRGKGVEVSFNPDGSINLHDLEQGINYENLNVFEDGADDGDEYDYAPLPEEEKIYSITKEADYNLVKDNSVFTEIQAKIALEVPYELIGDLNSTRVRSKDKVSLKIKTSYKIYKSLKRVDISTDVVNKAKGHRLRALFPTGISATHSYADDHFIVMERTIEKPRDDGWYQNMQSLYHQDTFVDITSNEQSVGEGLEKSAKKQEGHGLAIFNKGLCEYEIIETPAQMSNNPSQQTKTHTIALTLFRSVAWLSQRGHLGRKSGLNGPNLQTPGAQMMDHEFHFEYSIFAHQGDWVSGRVYHSAHAYNSPPRLMNSDHKLRNEVLNVDIPLERSFLQIFNPNIVLSSFKRSHRIGNAKDGIILRVFNPCSTNQDTGIGLGFGVKRVFETDLLEKDCSEVPIEKDENEEFSHLLHLNIPEHKILTLRIEVDE